MIQSLSFPRILIRGGIFLKVVYPICCGVDVHKTFLIGTIISEIGNDMSQFGSSKRLCCWAGLTPGNNESAGKKKSVCITRAGVYLKPALVQVAHAAAKATDNSYYRLKYEQISKRRGKKRAIIAIARMILTAIFQMMTTGEVWNPTDLFKVDMPESLKERQLYKAVKQATKFLEKQGLTVS